MEISVARHVSPEALRLALATGPSPESMPVNWTFKVNWKAFMAPADWLQAKKIEASGSLDDWRDPREDVYEK